MESDAFTGTFDCDIIIKILHQVCSLVMCQAVPGFFFLFCRRATALANNIPKNYMAAGAAGVSYSFAALEFCPCSPFSTPPTRFPCQPIRVSKALLTLVRSMNHWKTAIQKYNIFSKLNKEEARDPNDNY